MSGDNAEPGRRQLLDAGATVLRRAATDVMLRALTVRAVTKEARRSTGAFYHYWDTQADFVRDLIPYVLQPDAVLADDQLVGEVTVAADHDVTLDEMMTMFDAHCTSQASSELFQVQLLLWAMDGSPDVQEALRDIYGAWTQTLAPLYEAIFSRAGRCPLDDLGWTGFATIVAAAADGFAFRRRFDPDSASAEVARLTLLALVGTLTTPTDERRNIEHLRAELTARFAESPAPPSALPRHTPPVP